VNINKDCGATSPRLLCETVLSHGADIGLALDGDGDRLIMADHKGEVVDGDEALFVIAQGRRKEDTFEGGVVGTLMSNLGLEQALERDGIPFERTNVGDRYVMERMIKEGWQLGGENSGHIICLDRTTTGDGIVAALQVLHSMVSSGQTLHELKNGMQKFPQILVNVPLESSLDLDGSSLVQEAVKDVETQLADRGRVLLRPSGTEPLIRVMVEGENHDSVSEFAENIADAVRQAACS
jgi:phosphoglucosamine mutase